MELRINIPYVTPDSLQAYAQASPENMRQIKAEYSRLRKNVNRRIENLKQSEFRNTEAVRNHAEGFPALSELTNIRSLTKKLTELNRFASSRLSSVKGQRQAMKENIGNLQGMFPYLNENNYFDFLDFLEDLRESGRMYIVYETEDAGEEAFDDYQNEREQEREEDFDEDFDVFDDELEEELRPKKTEPQAKKRDPVKEAFEEHQKRKKTQISKAKAARRKQQAERERKQKLAAKTAKMTKAAKKGGIKKQKKQPKRKGKKNRKRR